MRPQNAVPVVANKGSIHSRCQVVSVHVPGDLEEVIFGIGGGIHGDNAVSAVSADSDTAYPRWVDRSVIDSAVNNKHIELVISRNFRCGTGCEGERIKRELSEYYDISLACLCINQDGLSFVSALC